MIKACRLGHLAVPIATHTFTRRLSNYCKRSPAGKQTTSIKSKTRWVNRSTMRSKRPTCACACVADRRVASPSTLSTTIIMRWWLCGVNSNAVPDVVGVQARAMGVRTRWRSRRRQVCDESIGDIDCLQARSLVRWSKRARRVHSTTTSRIRRVKPSWWFSVRAVTSVANAVPT